jgi:hypothetical protein
MSDKPILLPPKIPHAQKRKGFDIKFARILNDLLALLLISTSTLPLISMTLKLASTSQIAKRHVHGLSMKEILYDGCLKQFHTHYIPRNLLIYLITDSLQIKVQHIAYKMRLGAQPHLLQ